MSNIERNGHMIPDDELQNKLFEVALGWTQLAFLTCPFCCGSGETTIDSGGPQVYTCQPCLGMGLLHPKAVEKYKK